EETKTDTKSDAKADAQADAKDQPRPAEAAKDQPAKPEAAVATAPRRSGHIAVLISRKENRLYVRQNFEPLFDIPLT
ncbi:hypothetical protein, partial [Klebsiella pneumoniae]|uniref:hypothetical protein n=1 Tax=Klebsiella pneumoniae TaxID=573 RepID=UPI0037161607